MATVEEQAAFVTQVGPWAQESQRASGAPASVTIAQAILESGWGASELAQKASALFGVKYSASWPGEGNPYVKGAYPRVTGEYRPDGTYYTTAADFCRYASWRDSVLDHGLFLQRARYAPALSAFLSDRNPDAYAAGISAAGYATDPGYAAKLSLLMDRYKLRDWDVQPAPAPAPTPAPQPAPAPAVTDDHIRSIARAEVRRILSSALDQIGN